MTVGRVYMHKHAMDVCIQVDYIHKSLRLPWSPSNTSVRALWHNLGYAGEPWMLHSDELLIKNEHDWVDITDRVTNVRTRPGLP